MRCFEPLEGNMLQDDNSQPDRLPPHYGGPVSGEQFWPRPDIVDNLVET